MLSLVSIAIAIACAAAPASAQATDNEIVVRSVSSRAEIQRILDADNVDTLNLDTRSVADGMALIERGRAPEDFWAAYQTHVRAWEKLADAEDQARIMAQDPGKMPEATALVAEAQEQIEAT